MRIHTTEQDVTVLSDATEVPGLGYLPVHTFVIHAEEPVVIDTGLGTDDKGFVSSLGAELEALLAGFEPESSNPA